MNIFGFETIDSLPALYHPGSEMVVISDLHLGLEGSMSYEGSYVPQFQLEQLKEDLKEAAEETGASRILVNGDLKHEFSTTRFSEEKEIREFIEFLQKLFSDIVLVKGNHDTFVVQIAGDYGLELKDYHVEVDILFYHGHRELDLLGAEDYETVVIGHEHPALTLRDEIGVKEKVDCFLYGETDNGKRLVVLPAFSKISGGSTVNEVPTHKLLSPVLRNQVDIDGMKAVAVSKEAGLFEFPEIGKI